MQDKLKEEFPHGKFISPIFIAYDKRLDFETYYSPLKPHIIPLLLGLTKEELKALKINFINPVTKEKLAL